MNMSLKIMKSLPAGTGQKFQFTEFEMNEHVDVFEGNTVHMVEDEPIMETEPVLQEPSSSVSFEDMIYKAEQDAERIRKVARDEAMRIEKEAYGKGLAEGQKTGELLAQQKLEPVMKRLEASLNQLNQIRALSVQELTLDLIDLVIHVSEKVIKEEIESHPKLLVKMIRDAVHKVKEKDQMIIYLNPSDYAFLQENPGNQALMGISGNIKTEQDGSLSRGGLKIKTSYGDVDATLETQMGLIKKHVQERLMELQ
ncbi:MAG: hypothetical protein CSA81_04985 [Acidobacteria bacterium]|nr:MAG: hypothetical protein CSA81_04985 [Acidobacteriota bacterium]